MSNLYQFEVAEITIQPYADSIGPFTFDLSDQLPSGDDITSCEVVSSLDGVDSTAVLIDSSSEADNVLSVYFNYPGSDWHGEHKITFKYTLTSGAKDEADFFKVAVRDR